MTNNKGDSMKKLIIAALLTSGCTDARIGHIMVLGSQADVACYSAGRVIYEGRSTGRVESESQSDGWVFEEEGTGKLIRITADCVIKN
jgi:hypothetical protein